MKKLILIMVLAVIVVGVGPPVFAMSDELDALLIKSITQSLEQAGSVKKSMQVDNPELELSSSTKLSEKVAYMKLTRVYSWNSEQLWSDFKILQKEKIEKLYIYMNNPGGSAMDGLAQAEEIRKAKESGLEIIMEASGCVMSAAIPIFLSASKRVVDRHTIFLIHPATLFKFFAQESLKDLESQAMMIRMLRSSYADIVVENSKLDKETVLDMMTKDTWFDSNQALEWGMVDEIK